MHSIRWVADRGCARCSGDGYYEEDVVIAVSMSMEREGRVDADYATRRFVCGCVKPPRDPYEALADIGARLRTVLESTRISRSALERLANELENYSQQKPE